MFTSFLKRTLATKVLIPFIKGVFFRKVLSLEHLRVSIKTVIFIIDHLEIKWFD